MTYTKSHFHIQDWVELLSRSASPTLSIIKRNGIIVINRSL